MTTIHNLADLKYLKREKRTLPKISNFEVPNYKICADKL